jgi:hypothetical protein
MTVISVIFARRSGAAALGLAGAIIFAASSAAAAQGPPPGTPPPAGPSPSLPPPVSPSAPAPDSHEAPPLKPKTPRSGAALATHTVQLRDGRIDVPVRCAASGHLRLTLGRNLVGSARFPCDSGVAVARVRVSAPVARKLAQKPRRGLGVELQVVGRNLTDRVTLRTGSGREPHSLASAMPPSVVGTAVAQCGNRHSDPSGFTVVPPALFTETANSDWMWIRVWRNWYGYGWLPAEGWHGPYFAPAWGQGATYIGRYLVDYIDDFHGWYVAAGFEVYSRSTGSYEFRDGTMAEVPGGFPVVGNWCYVP